MLLFNSFILLTYLLHASACPREADLLPCTCSWPSGKDYAIITCDKLDNNHELVSAAGSLIGKKYAQSILIQDSVFDFIPSDAFKGLLLSKLEIKNSTLMALTDTDLAFQHLEDYLDALIMDSCQILNEWNWSIFRNLKKLKTLEIKNGAISSIEDLGQINLENLKTVDFSNSMINLIHDKAFAGSKTLRNIILRHNKISIIKRTMFPNPAFALVVLNLSYNKIEQLPNDIFSYMPFLGSLDISHNEILVLNEKVFRPVWNGLIEFKASGNTLRCDCRMSWILQSKKPQIVQATCAMPQKLKGKSISTLTSKDLWCMY